MEPIVTSGSGAVFRPAPGSTSPELSTLLRHGRMLMAEVLSNPGDGTLMLSIGRHTVPAETQLELDPGASFLVRVEEGSGGIVLHLLAAGEDGDSALIRALRGVVGSERPLGELFGELSQVLRAESARGSLSPALRDLALGLERHAANPEAGMARGAALRSLLFSSGLAHEALLAAVLSGRISRETLARLRGDFKALLLRAHAELADGPARQAVARVLASLEADQLLNLARERAGEPVVLSIPFPDSAGGWTTARLLVPTEDESETDPAQKEPGAFRLALGIELSHLGPVRADLALSPRSLAVRILVTRPDVAQRMGADLAELGARLGDGARRVQLEVRVGTRADIALGEAPLDIRYLREHRLMNVAG